MVRTARKLQSAAAGRSALAACMSTTTSAPTTPQEALAYEAAARGRASIATWAAGLLSILGAILSGVGISGLPESPDRVVTVVDALGHMQNGTDIPPGRLATQVLWLGDHAALPIAGTVLVAIGALLLFVPLSYLYRATKARNPQLTGAVIVLASIGCVSFAIGRVASEVSRYVGAADFAGGDNSQALDALTPPAYSIGQILMLLGGFALGFTFIMLCMNAMRAGLLTRFMGVLGMIVGATFVLPLDQQGIIRSFWLIALGFLIAGRWPSGMPPAWVTGEAVPWPSQAELRRQRDAGAGQPLPDTPAPVPRAPDGLTQGQRRKKRKKG